LTLENQQRRVVDPAVGHSLMRKYLLARFVYGATCIVLLALASFELFFSLSSSKTNWWFWAILAFLGILAGSRWWHWSAMAARSGKART
jgi:preprotein translocase subunit SecF